MPVEAFKTVSPSKLPGSFDPGAVRSAEPDGDLPFPSAGRNWEWRTCRHPARIGPCLAESASKDKRKERGRRPKAFYSLYNSFRRYGCIPVRLPPQPGGSYMLARASSTTVRQALTALVLRGGRRRRAGRKEWDRVPFVHDMDATSPVLRLVCTKCVRFPF